MMEDKADILIAGGGIIGCAIAYYLSKAGRDVLVLDQEGIGTQASHAAAGLLAPLGPLSGPGPFADLLLTSFTLFPSLVATLEKEIGLHLSYTHNGALRTIRNPKRIPHLQKRFRAWQALGLQMRWLDGDEARRAERALSSEICAAIHVPEESHINAAQLVQAFALAAQHYGTRFSPHTQVVDVATHQSSVVGVSTAQGNTISCRHLVIATGAWSACWNDWLDIPLPVSPLRGQILMVRQLELPLRQTIFGEAIYLVPKGEHILIGATKEEAGFATHTTREGISWLQTTACRLVPALHTSSIEQAWAGLRPKTPDMQPLLGPISTWENVTVAVGHNSVGIILSPITGQAIAETVLTGHVPAIIRPFSPARL